MSNVFSGEKWSIDRFVSGFSNNAFLVTCMRTSMSVIIDTPADPTELIEAAEITRVEAVLITHGHRDHVEGFGDVSRNFPVPAGIGADDRQSLPTSANVVIEVPTGNTIVVGDITLRAMATPGHTPGSTCYVLESPDNSDVTHVFTGDTLFPGGPGKSSSHEALNQIVESLKSHIFTLIDSTVVLPGHGEFTTIGDSKREFAVFESKPPDPSLYGDVTWT